MKNKTLIVALVAILVIAIGGYVYPQASQQIKETIVGAVSTLDGVDNPFVSIGGGKYYYYFQPMTATSSTVCSIKNPFNATSTLVNYSIRVNANGLGAQSLNLSTSSTAYASSSPYFIKEVAIGTGQRDVVWIGNATTTNTVLIGTAANNNVGISDNIIGPSNYLNLGVATSTGSAGIFSSYLTGSCSGIIKKL